MSKSAASAPFRVADYLSDDTDIAYFLDELLADGDPRVIGTTAKFDILGVPPCKPLSRRRSQTLLTSDYAFEEARRNMEVKHPERLIHLTRMRSLLELAPRPAASHIARASAHSLPEKDVPVLTVAIAAGADVLVLRLRDALKHVIA